MAEINKQKNTFPVVLTIAGSDSSGGAGVSADIKTFSAFDCYGVSAVTAVTAQNTLGVVAVHLVPADIVGAQIRAVFEDFSVAAVKIGMVGSALTVDVIADELERWGSRNIVVDTPFISSTGAVLANEDVRQAVVRRLFPMATVITPNLDEAADLLGCSVATSIDDMVSQAEALGKLGAKNVVVKGGHLDGNQAIDILYDGKMSRQLSQNRLNAPNNHGTGCALSAAIAAGLANDEPLNEAVIGAKQWLTGVLEHSALHPLGTGIGPLITK